MNMERCIFEVSYEKEARQRWTVQLQMTSERKCCQTQNSHSYLHKCCRALSRSGPAPQTRRSRWGSRWPSALPGCVDQRTSPTLLTKWWGGALRYVPQFQMGLLVGPRASSVWIRAWDTARRQCKWVNRQHRGPSSSRQGRLVAQGVMTDN